MKNIQSENKKYDLNNSGKKTNEIKRNGHNTNNRENNMRKSFKSNQRKYRLEDVKIKNKINKIDKTK